MDTERKILTYDEAVSMISNNEYIHTFRQGGQCILGANWKRNDLLDAFKKYQPELSGEIAASMKHGLVFIDDHGPCFVETIQDLK